MSEFFHIAFGFPTLLWTGLLVLVLAYWLFVILGAIDLEFFDAHLDLDLDVDLDLDNPHLDLVDVDASGGSVLATIASALGLGKVPITILVTFFALSGWTLSYFGMLYAAPHLRFPALGAVVLGLTFVLAAPIMGALAHPLKGVFTITTRDGGESLVGKTCIVSTGSVTSEFGQARFDDGGAGLLLAVRCDSGSGRLERNDTALIIGYDADRNVYSVEPYDQFLTGSEKLLGSSESQDTAGTTETAAQAQQFVSVRREG